MRLRVFLSLRLNFKEYLLILSNLIKFDIFSRLFLDLTKHFAHQPSRLLTLGR